jgi:hypothetical protein
LPAPSPLIPRRCGWRGVAHTSQWGERDSRRKLLIVHGYPCLPAPAQELSPLTTNVGQRPFEHVDDPTGCNGRCIEITTGCIGRCIETTTGCNGRCIEITTGCNGRCTFAGRAFRLVISMRVAKWFFVHLPHLLALLHACGFRLSVVPGQVSQMANLEHLSLDRNKLVHIAPSVGLLQSLRTFKASRNQLCETDIPKVGVGTECCPEFGLVKCVCFLALRRLPSRSPINSARFPTQRHLLS